jgi:hypothetical protein
LESVARPRAETLTATTLENLSMQPAPARARQQPSSTTAFHAPATKPSDALGPMELPVLPLIFVAGSSWSISFAQRINGETVRCLFFPKPSLL